MNDEFLETHLKFYGISPWEIEVIYGYLNSRFTVVEEEIEQDDEDYVSMVDFEIPLPFNEEFFQWFDYSRWENLKSLFKEMKRRYVCKQIFCTLFQVYWIKKTHFLSVLILLISRINGIIY